jgi:hypothetical protein
MVQDCCLDLDYATTKLTDSGVARIPPRPETLWHASQCQFRVMNGQNPMSESRPVSRKWAEECFEWAREAHDEGVRQHYANLGQVWLECAVRAELRPGVITPPEQTTDKVA